MGGHSHKPGALKQSNKKHKTSSASKRSVKRSFGNGRVDSQSLGEGKLGKKGRKSHKMDGKNARNNRVHRNLQIRKNKNRNSSDAKNIGSLNGPPKIIGVISLSKLADVHDCLVDLTKESSWKQEYDTGMTYAYYEQHKARCAFLLGQDIHDTQEALEISRISDLLIFVVNVADGNNVAEEFVDECGKAIISAVKAIGCPEILFCYQGIDRIQPKFIKSVKQLVQEDAERTFGVSTKTGDLSKISLVTRQMCNITPRSVTWRKHRSYLVADSCDVLSPSKEGSITVKLRGYLRGKPMALNSLMHLCGIGVGRIDVVRSGGNPFATSRGGRAEVQMADSADVFLKADPAKQDSLQMEADPDEMQGEQTWPTEEEMLESINMADAGAGRHRRAAPALIKSGMSSYQADWYVDEEGHFDADGAQVSEEDIVMEEEKEMEIPDQEDGDDVDMEGGSMIDTPVHDAVSDKQRLRSLADDDAMFPDEIDTPTDRAARDRFARFRALQSFRSSYWHPKENLPHDYSRIFQFDNFQSVQRNVLGMSNMIEHEASSGGGHRDANYPFAFRAPQGESADGMSEEAADGELYILGDTYVEIVLADLPVDSDVSKLMSVVAVGLLEHENKLSVLHFSIRRTGNYSDIIKSKEPLIFVAGFRSFEAKPIFSESNLNCDKHKMERFLREDCFSMASVYGPVTYNPCPLLVYKRLDEGRLVLVATGSLSKTDPDRIMLKKIVLTGLPIRVRKRVAVVKHLFYNTNDVRWFRPAELITKHGLHGHIKESIGTHGLFKCIFSAPITQNDTVMLVLYKRVYPKMVAGGVVTR